MMKNLMEILLVPKPTPKELLLIIKRQAKAFLLFTQFLSSQLSMALLSIPQLMQVKQYMVNMCSV